LILGADIFDVNRHIYAWLEAAAVWLFSAGLPLPSLSSESSSLAGWLFGTVLRFLVICEVRKSGHVSF
jgi:hypothetical protein